MEKKGKGMRKGELKLTELGGGSRVLYQARFFSYSKSWYYFDYLDRHIPWNRPTIRVFARSCLRPRFSCCVASRGLPELVYSGLKRHAYSWDDFSPIKGILDCKILDPFGTCK